MSFQVDCKQGEEEQDGRLRARGWALRQQNLQHARQHFRLHPHHFHYSHQRGPDRSDRSSIDCARRALDPLAGAFGTGGSWLICVRDHGDHVHIRVQVRGEGDENDASEWLQVNSRFGDFQTAMSETAIRHRYHMHEGSGSAARESAEPHASTPRRPSSDTAGVPIELVAALPHVRLDARDAAAAANADDVCAICYDAFHAGETVAQLPCGHRYHANCVGAWLKNATTCPGCRAEVTDEAVKAAAGASNLPGLSPPDTGAAAPLVVVSQAAAPPVVASAPPADQVALAVAWPEEYGLQLRAELRAEGDRRLQAQIAAADRAGAHVARTQQQAAAADTSRPRSIWESLGCGGRQHGRQRGRGFDSPESRVPGNLAGGANVQLVATVAQHVRLSNAWR